MYEARLSRFSKPSWELLPHAGLNEPERAKLAESDALLARIRPDDTVILLDERGEQWTSPEFARRLERWQVSTRRRLVFVIGGAYGVDQRVHDRAEAIWSLSKLVFPHQLVRVLLLEQLYRAYTINNGLPYHHG